MSSYYATTKELDESDVAMLAEPRVCVVSTVSPSGDPHVVPCWFLFEDGRFLMTVYSQARRAKNISDKGRARVLVEHPFGYVSAVGNARILTGPDIRDVHERIVARYLTDAGRDNFLDASGVPDDAAIELVPERWMSWDMQKTSIPSMIAAGHDLSEIMSWLAPAAKRDQ